ncbi:hypothetical protein [Rhodococcus sp. T7]|uniref:hypothetical protein n=2 Tax=Rhodococcus TaxID=1827 RepID=UPI00135810E8|nr:hypothetical protein [Rhodococcus sp. T7]
MASPYQVVLTGNDRKVLGGWVRAGSTPQRSVLRALIVLMSADGDANARRTRTWLAEHGFCFSEVDKRRGAATLTAPKSAHAVT